MFAEGPRVLAARSGVLNVVVGGAPYHSVYDPVREAEKFCASMRVEEADVIFLFGWGLGYVGRALQSRLKAGARVFVFEPDAALFEEFHEIPDHNGFRDSRFHFVVGDNLSRFFDEWALQGCQDNDQFLWVEWPAAVALHKETLDFLKSNFKTRLRDKAANLLTHFRRGGMYFENAIANFRYQDSADVGNLFGRFKGTPLVLVSAGPSLDLNVAQLRGVEDRCFILSVDTALRPLLNAGVTPHAVILADPSELNARHVVGALPESVFMIAEQAVKPEALDTAKRRFLFGLGLFPDPLFAEFGFGKSSLDVWGSVATAALDLACRMSCDPIVFIGQDFGFSWGREYTRHTVFHANTFSDVLGGPLTELDIFGNPIRTTENLIAYRDHFSRRMRQEANLHFINATEGGILREPCEVRPLKEVLDSMPKKPANVSARLAECYKPRKISREALKHFLKVLKLRKRDCNCLESFLELTAKQELLENNRAALEEKIRWGIERVEAALR